MCQIATQSSSATLDVDPWEAIQTDYQPTALVLDHFEHELNISNNNNLPSEEEKGEEAAVSVTGARKPVRVALLAGADLLQTMNIPGVWSVEDIGE